MLDTLSRPPLSLTLSSVDMDGGTRIERDGRRLLAVRGGKRLAALRLDPASNHLTLDDATRDLRDAEHALSAAVEALFVWSPQAVGFDLDLDAGVSHRSELRRHLVRSGLVRVQAARLEIRADTFMQRRGNWLADADIAPYPLDYVMSEGRRHPRRPPKPVGTVYARHIPWLGETVSFRALTLDDLPLFHGWMNDPRVAAFWDEAGTIDAHRDYLAKLIADPHMLPLIGCFGDRPFGYFEIYWAKENRIAPFYDAGDYDRGWHVAIGEDAVRGRRYISAWLPSLMHYLFLDDPRTNRIVGEPASNHAQQIRNLEVSGFAKLKTFDFPHKRATLVMLLRERFFGDRLWLPAAATPTSEQA